MSGVPKFVCLCILLCCTLATASRNQLDVQDVRLIGGGEAGTQKLDARNLETTKADGPEVLELCECEVAQGGPHGLSCGKEGWFISNFQQAGQWLNGGGLVPLSHAVCCRPCLPKKLPGSNDTALAVLSLGCHASSNPGSASLRCESAGGSFVSGWSESVRVPDAANFYYPIGAAECCTPSLLLAGGEARELERCDCVEENDINCGGQTSGRLLSGYLRWGVSQIGEFVPIAPALCCKSCISDKVIPADSCFDLNFCSGHGVCNLGVCECAAGFGGADCKHKVENEDGSLPQWLILIIILCSGFGFVIIMLVLGKIIRILTSNQVPAEEEGSEEEEQLQEPLIIGLDSDDEGSVGSQDSTDYETEDESMPPPLRSRRHAEEEAVGGGTLVDPEQERAAAREREGQRADPFEISQEAGDRQQEIQEASSEDQEHARLEADRATIEVIRRVEATQRSDAGGGGEDDVVPSQSSLTSELKEASRLLAKDKERSGVPGFECSVCLNRPIQVAVVPCGHMCMCRRCARRLATCPVCRIRILRRQRIFVGG